MLVKSITIFLALLAVVSAQDRIFGLTVNGRIFSFDASSTISNIGTPVQLTANTGQSIRSMDFRPANGQLYLLASTAPTSSVTSQLYLIDTSSFVLTALDTATLSTLSSEIYVDFNPQVDRLRVVTGDNKNFRLFPNGTLVQSDTDIAYASTDPGAGTIPSISAIAYNNNVNGATSTTLFALEVARNSTVTIGSDGGMPTSPNTGQLFTVAAASQPLARPNGLDINSAGTVYASNAAGDIFTVSSGTFTQIGSVASVLTGGDTLRTIAASPNNVIVSTTGSADASTTGASGDVATSASATSTSASTSTSTSTGAAAATSSVPQIVLSAFVAFIALAL